MIPGWIHNESCKDPIFFLSSNHIIFSFPFLSTTVADWNASPGLQSVFESPFILRKPSVFGKLVWKDLLYRDETMPSAKEQIVKTCSTQVREQNILLVQHETNLVMIKSQSFGLWKYDTADKQGIARTTGKITSCLHLWFFTRGPRSSPPDGDWPKYVHPGPMRPEPAAVTLPRL